MDISEQPQPRENKLVGDLKSVIKDAEDLLKNTGHQVGDGYQTARAKFEASLKSAKAELRDVEGTLAEKKDKVVDATSRYVRVHPWTSVGAGAVAGLVIGLLVKRKH